MKLHKKHVMIPSGPNAFREVLTLASVMLAFALPQVHAQEAGGAGSILKRYLNRVLGESEDSSAPKFINYPTLAYTPETSWEIGVAGLYVYSANRDSTNRLSEIKSFTFYTLENQYGIWTYHSLYSDQNKWFFYGRARYQSFPLYFYGIGRDSPAQVQSIIDGKSLIIRERIMRETQPSLYVGLELDFQDLHEIEYVDAVPDFVPPEHGRSGSRNFGAGVGLIYNNIHNAMNPRHGTYSEWGFLQYNANWGSEFDFTTYIADHRIYRTIGQNKVIAAQAFGQFTTGTAPFNMLSLMGGEGLMRGYYLGRHRDEDLLAGQVEYRILPFSGSERWGATAFMAMGQVFGDERPFGWSHFLPAGGAGLRFLIFPDKDIYTRLDFAFTREGNGIYFYIGEAF